MPNNSWKKVAAIYDAAVKMPKNQQKAFVSKQAKEDAQVVSQVMKMLEAHDQPFMDKFPGKIKPENIDVSLPKRFGHFEIIKKIATGGMGRIYLAQSMTADVPIIVALKTIRIELINQDMKQKFQNEKEILSKLKHKNIATLIDAGISENKIPYIATEWVDGINIKEYCVEHKLSIKHRLKLFLQICEAMSFAHNKLIIHRDLKPDNILVNKQRQVKLLDFGIAKIVDESQNQHNHTQIFTPDYAAPEQLSGDLCTASTDIYSLGIILFETLTNTRRFNFSGIAISDIIKTIAEPKQIDLTKIIPDIPLPYSVRGLKGALSNIINKAMHVDPNRRYESVSAFVADIDNYLDKRPVTAMKDSYWYKFKMLIVRNKVSSFFISLAIISASLGAIITIQQLNEKLIEVQKSQQISDFLIDSIQASDPDLTKGKNVSVVEFLQNAKVRIQESQFADKKLTSNLKQTIGVALGKVGEYKDAEKLLTQSIKSDETNIKAHIALTHLYLEQQSFDKANKQLEYLSRNDGLLSPIEKIQTQQLAAKILFKQGKFVQALETIQASINTQEQQKTNLMLLIESKIILAALLDEYGQVDKSIEILRETLKLSQKTYGNTSTQTTDILNQLANVLSNSSPVPWDEIFSLYQQSLNNQIKIYGQFHPVVAKTLLNEGFAFKFTGKLEKAVSNASKAREIAIRNFGEKHMLTAHIDLLWSQINFIKGDINKAIKQLENVVNIYAFYYGGSHFVTNQVKTTLSAYLIKAKRGQDALAMLLPLYQSQKEQLGDNNKATLYVKLNLIKTYNLLHEYDKSVKEAIEALQVSNKFLGKENIVAIGIQMELVQSLINDKQTKKAIELSEKLLNYELIKNNELYKKKALELLALAKNLRTSS